MKKRSSGLRLAVMALLVFSAPAVLVACGGGGGGSDRLPDGACSVQGEISLPAGSGLNVADLSVTTAYGSYPVAPTGRFAATVDTEGASEVGAETATGDLVLLGTSQGNQVRLSAQSTAEALLYYAIGGMWLPAEVQDRVWELLEDVEGSGAVAAEIERLLASGVNALTEPDEALTAALEAAHQQLLGSAAVSNLGVLPTNYTPMAEASSNVLIHQGTRTLSGAQVVHDPNGGGIVVLNEYRRPSALLVYEVSYDDVEGVNHPVEPPKLVTTIDVPATGKLELLNSLYDVITGDAPFAPVMSPAADLPVTNGARKTYYELVLIGASANSAEWPITSDPRFAGQLEEWEDVYFEQTLELFLDELLLPLIETYTLGKSANVSAANLTKLRERMQIIYRTHLAEVGVHLTRSQRGYALAIKQALHELATNRHLRTGTLDALEEALSVADRNKFEREAMERRLAGRAAAATVAAAVQGIMLTGDVSAILSNLVSSTWAVSWQAEAIPLLFTLSPTKVELDVNGRGEAFFEVKPIRATDQRFLYRWTTTGVNGTISDYFQDGKEFQTDSNEVFYTHDRPLHMRVGEADTVTVEVFPVDEGVNTIPAGAEPIYIGTATIQVTGDDYCEGQEPWCDDYYCWCFPVNN